jgi:hypothetical protein
MHFLKEFGDAGPITFTVRIFVLVALVANISAE